YIRTLYPSIYLFFYNDPAPTEIYTLSLHDALPIYLSVYEIISQLFRLKVRLGSANFRAAVARQDPQGLRPTAGRAECLDPRRHEIGRDTSELQSRGHLVCRLLLEKKKKKVKRR